QGLIDDEQLKRKYLGIGKGGEADGTNNQFNHKWASDRNDHFLTGSWIDAYIRINGCAELCAWRTVRMGCLYRGVLLFMEQQFYSRNRCRHSHGSCSRVYYGKAYY